MKNKKLISKENLIKQIAKKAAISAAKAQKAYECVLNESPAFRSQAIKTVKVKKEVPVTVTKQVIKEVIKEVTVVKEVPVEVIKEVTLVREVVDDSASEKSSKELAKLDAAWKKKQIAWDKSIADWKKKEASWKKGQATWKAQVAQLKKELSKKPKTIEVIKEVQVEIVKEVQVTKGIDMEMLKKMVGKLGTKQVSKKVVGETRNVKEGKIVSRKEVKPGSTKGKVVTSKKGVAKKTSGKKDDLTRIEGIGPKIAEHLINGKISTFRQLADAKVSRLQEILDAAGPRYRMHNPGSWPRQSKLAADGKWEALDKLQDELDGGR